MATRNKTLRAQREERKQNVLEVLQGYVGRNGTIELEGLTFEVKVSDAKRVYGHDHVLVHPKKGDGQKWVRAASLQLA